MPSLTIRNIPEETLDRLRAEATRDHRSVNSQVLKLLEDGLEPNDGVEIIETMSREAQLAVWESLCGTWEDTRTASEIVADIRSLRTMGREVDL
jgi:plasmid stability protein